MSGRTTRRPGEITIPPGSGIDKAHRCTCWPKPDDPRPCTPQTCDWRCRACHVHGRPFYSHGELQYLGHGSGPLAAELDRLWRAKGTMKGGAARDAAGHNDASWRALPRGAAGLAPRRRRPRTVTELYYPGLQDPPPGHDGRNAGRAIAGRPLRRLAGLPCRAAACRPNQLAAAATDISGEVVDDLVLAVSEAVTTAILYGSGNLQPVKVTVGVQGGWIEATICDRAAPHPAPLPLRALADVGGG